jgi:hypothetical protein
MPRQPKSLTPGQVKAAADRAEGLAPDEAEGRLKGRPASFKPEYAEKAKKLCELGATDVEMADFFEVSARTLYRWLIKYPEFCQALKAGKESADERVERSLYHRATGYTYDAVKIFMPAGAKEPVYAKYREHVPPDTTAMIFWLKNRRSEDWRDKSEHVVRHEVASITDDELQHIATGRGEGTPAKKGDPPQLH